MRELEAMPNLMCHELECASQSSLFHAPMPSQRNDAHALPTLAKEKVKLLRVDVRQCDPNEKLEE